MDIYKQTIFIAVFLLNSTIVAAANPSINEIHSCLVLVSFVDNKLSGTAHPYSDTEIEVIHAGLSGYIQHLDDEVITPKLLNLYGGNASQASLMKKLFTRQQARFVKYLEDRHNNQKFTTDYVTAIRECGIKTRVQGGVAASLNQALVVMTKS